MRYILLISVFAFPVLTFICTIAVINTAKLKKNHAAKQPETVTSVKTDVALVVLFSFLSVLIPFLSPYRIEYMSLFTNMGLDFQTIPILLSVLPTVLLLPVLVSLKSIISVGHFTGIMRIILIVFALLYTALLVYMICVKLSHPAPAFATPG